ncbi:arginase [Mesorhizobium albiziae]|uniref:Arginase n=1 Tax=Neomesorhizobium albiziae TaxID=335020 RepID=A0A1I4EP42_9HYPH|nr:arginase family protein [Mesorhizobium albiziae]GLS30740.1 arginase [Mesorhizobium albiziae]SFL07518.1 arginase [Mesorhizobium albiziae]
MSGKTLRLHIPQWQGGNLEAYHFGAQLLAWLAPAATGPVATVEVAEPDGSGLSWEDGIVARSVLLKQLDRAAQVLRNETPDKVVVLGGDCLVDLAPFAYLNERYEDELAILWVDAHPDVMTPQQTAHAHAMVLGNLMGQGDANFTERVARPVKPERVMYAGLFDMSPAEWTTIERLGLRRATPSQLIDSSQPVIEWLRSIGAKHVAIHLDLDVIDPAQLRSVYFTRPDAAPDAFDGIPQGRMTVPQVVRLLNDVAEQVEVVGLGITEHLPWDAITIRDMLQALPLIGKG